MGETASISPFEQLLCVIPQNSSQLLPKPFDELLKSKAFARFTPEKFNVNCAGKKFEYEGIVELPPVDISFISREYNKSKHLLSKFEYERRNVPRRPNTYQFWDTEGLTYQSKYGNIKDYKVQVVEM